MERAKSPGEGVLAQLFLGIVVEICIVTRDHRKTMDGLLRLGIGPFQVHTFNSENVHQQTSNSSSVSQLKVLSCGR